MRQQRRQRRRLSSISNSVPLLLLLALQLLLASYQCCHGFALVPVLRPARSAAASQTATARGPRRRSSGDGGATLHRMAGDTPEAQAGDHPSLHDMPPRLSSPQPTSVKIPTKVAVVGRPQARIEKEYSIDTILKELAEIQRQGPKNYCILGTRHCTFLHQQIIELLAYALVLSGNHVFTSGAGGTNAATIRGALRAERPDLLTVVLPQSLAKQGEESQELLREVGGCHMHRARRVEVMVTLFKVLMIVKVRQQVPYVMPP